MEGVLIVNKPLGMTSRDVVNIISGIFHTKKVGHCGTLDPMATGVLIICIGRFTKLVEILTGCEKIYEFEACLGVETDTLDVEGNILEDRICILDNKKIDEAISIFPRCYMQKVPIYSAVRIDGKKLYEYARNGEDVIIPERKVEIFNLKRTSSVKIVDNHTFFKGEIKVSKGTFIRSFVRDYANSLNTIGMMNGLTRIKQGNFSIKEAYTIEDIKNGNYKFVDIKDVLSNYPIYKLSDDEAVIVKNGALIDKKYKEEKIVFEYENRILAIYQNYEKDSTKMKPWKML